MVHKIREVWGVHCSYPGCDMEIQGESENEVIEYMQEANWSKVHVYDLADDIIPLYYCFDHNPDKTAVNLHQAGLIDER